jgi:hypothetical protein
MAAQHLQQRGFTGTVVTNQASDFTCRETSERADAARCAGYAKGEMVERKGGVGLRLIILHISQLK